MNVEVLALLAVEADAGDCSLIQIMVALGSLTLLYQGIEIPLDLEAVGHPVLVCVAV